MKDDIKRAFELCSRVCERITNKYGGHLPAMNYPEYESAVILVWTVTGIIENGGFKYLFSSVLPGDPSCKYTVQAFNQIGCARTAELIQKAVCLFPDCLPPVEDAERVQWYERQPKSLTRSLDSEFWNELDNITISLAKYIKAHKLE